MTDKQFIKVTVTIDVIPRDFVYTPTGDAARLASGAIHTYRITVKHDGISVQAVTGGQWGSEGEGEPVTSYITYTTDDLKPGYYIYTDREISDGGLRSRYADGTVK